MVHPLKQASGFEPELWQSPCNPPIRLLAKIIIPNLTHSLNHSFFFRCRFCRSLGTVALIMLVAMMSM